MVLLLLLLLLTASGYVPGGSGTTIHNTIQYNTQKTQNNTYTHKTIITNTITQNTFYLVFEYCIYGLITGVSL
jgi:hypothetical protein